MYTYTHIHIYTRASLWSIPLAGTAGAPPGTITYESKCSGVNFPYKLF